MLYEAIRLGCKIFHAEERSYNVAYRTYLRQRDSAKWESPVQLDLEEVSKLVTFANRWSCRMPSDTENKVLMLEGLKEATLTLSLLRRSSLLDIRFDRRVLETTNSQLISDSFDRIRCAGRRSERVATSKMMHAAINGALFVPWDSYIIAAYGCEPGHGREYADTFLPEMKWMAETAIEQVMIREGHTREIAVASLTPCQESLAKVLDEFNWVKYCLGDRSVRQAERM